MKKTLSHAGWVLVAIGALGLTGFAGERGRGGPPAGRISDPVVVDRAGLLGRLDTILSDLDEIRGRSDAAATARLARVALDVRRLRREVELASSPTLPRVVVSAPRPMLAGEYRGFLGSLGKLSFAGEKVVLVRRQAEFSFFTSVQAAGIVRQIPSWGRVEAGAVLHPRVVDPERFHLVFAELTFASDRVELSQRLEETARGRVVEDARGRGR